MKQDTFIKELESRNKYIEMFFTADYLLLELEISISEKEQY